MSDGDTGQFTSPLASPHRAGHYSGLHPEDQPFQSSFFLRVERPLEPEQVEADMSRVLDLEAEEVAPSTYPARPPRLEEYEEEEEDASAYSALADLPTLYSRRSPETPLPPTLTAGWSGWPRSRPPVIKWLVTAALISFLLATGLLAFLLVGKDQSQAQVEPPRLIATPGEVRVGDLLQLAGKGFDARHIVALTRDAGLSVLDTQGKQILPTTDAQGAFQMRLPITAAWQIGLHTLQASEEHLKTTTMLTIQAVLAGPPSLQLGFARIDLGSGNPGTLSQKTLALSNAGGGRVSWSARSDVAWLSLNPGSGSFAGNTIVTLTVNRANLPPEAYLGQIIFTQNQGTTQTLHVSMTVDTSPANLVLSSASLAFAGTPVQSPAGQTIVLQNNGGQPLNWSAGSTTSDGGAWLNVTPASGRLDANTSVPLTVTVNTLKMVVGSYQGGLAFNYAGGQGQQVTITLTVAPPPQASIHLSQQSLSFRSNQGFDPTPQNVVVVNSGNAQLNWAIQSDIIGQAYLHISPASGSLAPGQSVSVVVAPHLYSANGTLKSTLTIVDSDTGTTVPNQQIVVVVAVTNQAVITLNTSRLDFTHSSSNTDTTSSLIITNTGSLPLNWSLVAATQVPWLSFNTVSGSLAAGGEVFINVRCLSTSMKPGTYTVTLTVKDTDTGAVVAPQTVNVTLVVSA